jgi:hypothetical protein
VLSISLEEIKLVSLSSFGRVLQELIDLVLSISLLITAEVLKSRIIAALDAGLDVRSVVKSIPVSTDIDGQVTAVWVFFWFNHD